MKLEIAFCILQSIFDSTTCPWLKHDKNERGFFDVNICDLFGQIGRFWNMLQWTFLVCRWCNWFYGYSGVGVRKAMFQVSPVRCLKSAFENPPSEANSLGCTTKKWLGKKEKVIVNQNATTLISRCTEVMLNSQELQVSVNFFVLLQFIISVSIKIIN